MQMSDFKAKITEFDFRWGSVPDPAGEVYSAPPDPLDVFKGHTSKGIREEGRKKGKKKERGMGEEGREGGKGKREVPVKSVKPRTRSS